MENSRETVYRSAVTLSAEARQAGLKCDIFSVLDQIIIRYQESWRIYHNLDHIADGLRKLDRVKAELNDPLCTYFALLCHDIVYVPGCADNELRSADLAIQLARTYGIKVNRCRIIHQMVRATKGHQIPDEFGGSPTDLALLLDIDLSGLADEPRQYVKVGDKLRREADISKDAFKVGNANFSRMLLDRVAIFKSSFFAGLEKRARHNLGRAVAAIK